MVNIDTVYQTVQALANKEQRGYITPQEFNLFANQAQLDIFEQYLYDLNALRERRPEEHQLGDSFTMLMNKLRPWYFIANVISGTDLPVTKGHIGRIFYKQGTGQRKTLKKMDPGLIQDLIASPFHRPGFVDPVYFDDGYGKIQVWSRAGQTTTTTHVQCEVVSGRPSLAYWGYIIVNEKPVYDPNASNNFDLEAGEQTDLVIKILKLAGVSIEDEQLYAAAQADESLNIQQENK